MKKILVIYNSVGLGHKVVAENIAKALEEFSNYEVELLDILRLYEGRFTKTSTKIYELIIKYWPSLWGFFYTNKFFQFLTLPLRIPLAKLKLKKLKNFVSTSRPDLVLTSHPNATALMVALKKSGEYHGPIVTTFSDFHFQPFWYFFQVDKYLVMTREQRQELTSRGYPSKQIVLTGLPAHPAFGKSYPALAVSKEFGLARGKPLVLVMGGSRSWGIKIAEVEALLGSRLDIQIMVLVSLNQELYQGLQKLAAKHPGQLLVLGNLSPEEVAKLFSIAKILVTKPGGLTIGQALASNLPMILVNPLPTMEEKNQDYLEGQGVASVARDSGALLGWVETLLLDRKFYQELKLKMKNLSSREAGRLAAQAVIDTLTRRD